MGLRLHGAVIFLSIFVMVLAGPAGAQVGVNLYGASYHFGTEPGDGIRNFNPGAGLHWTFDRGPRAALELSAGIFRDSYGNANRHWALGARFCFVGPFELGAQLVRAESPSLLEDMPHMGILPLVAVRGRRLAVQGVYMPEIDGLNGLRTIGFVATVYPFGEGYDWESRGDLATRGWRALEFRIGSGLDLEAPPGAGLAWRRMFNDRHGLRIGLDVQGVFVTGPYEALADPGLFMDDVTEYTTSLAIQYLRIHPQAGRIAPYWAAGVKTGFTSHSEVGYIEDKVTESLIAGIGVEYDLGARWRLVGEYECSVGRTTKQARFAWIRAWDRGTEIEHGIHLGVVAVYGAPATREGQP